MVRSNPMAEYGSYARQRPKFRAGTRCLDFLNTREEGGAERLTSYAEFAIWSKAAGLTDATGLRRLLALAAEEPQAAAETLVRVRAAREALGGLLGGSRKGRAAAVKTVNAMLANDRFVLQLEAGGVGLRERWVADCAELRRPLLTLLREAALLLSSPDAARIHHCANDDCHWFFLDTSRNQSRRWCEMETCGNQAKARAHYRRHR